MRVRVTSVRELLPLFARREPLLSELRGTGRSKCELARALDVSRSTVDRTVRRLESHGVAERRDGGYGLTLAGRLLFDEYRTLTGRADGVLAAREALAVLPPDADIDPAALAGADVTLADRTVPYGPAERQLELVDAAEYVDLLGTAIAPRFVEAYRDAIVEDGTEVRAAVTSAVAEALVAEFPGTLAELLATGRLTLRELDEPLSYSLARCVGADRTCLALMTRSSDGARGHVENDTPEAVAFAEACFERYWTRAEELAVTGREA